MSAAPPHQTDRQSGDRQKIQRQQQTAEPEHPHPLQQEHDGQQPQKHGGQNGNVVDLGLFVQGFYLQINHFAGSCGVFFVTLYVSRSICRSYVVFSPVGEIIVNTVSPALLKSACTI